jgi:uncharacterized protein (TIGR01244 family)
MKTLDLPNARAVADGLISSGQPSSEQLREAAATGVKTVVNLCVSGECGWDEAAVVKSLGMHYVAIPVGGATDVTEANARKLHDVVEDESNYPMVIHCGSGNRVGALFALKAFHLEGCDPEEAVRRGRVAGLTLLEPHVRQCLAKG